MNLVDAGTQFWHELAARPDGPFGARFVLQLSLAYSPYALARCSITRSTRVLRKSGSAGS